MQIDKTEVLIKFKTINYQVSQTFPITNIYLYMHGNGVYNKIQKLWKI
jgi:hypothetical protein